MNLEQAKRIYKTWKHHPDMIIDAEDATNVIDEFVKLAREMKKEYIKLLKKQNEEEK